MANLASNRKSRGGLLTTFAVVTFALHLLVLFLFIIQGLNIRQLSQRKPPNFVQMIDGEPPKPTDNLARNPEQIRQFVGTTMKSMFNWSGELQPRTIEQAVKPEADVGIMVVTSQGGSKKVSTSSWIASFAISEDFRAGFLSAIAQMTPPEVFSQNPNQAMSAKLVIQRLDTPEKIAPGQWRVGMVANLIQKKLFDNRQVVIPFNRDVLVRAVDYFPYPIPELSTDIQKAIYSNRVNKLEIYEIRNLCLLDNYSKDNTESDLCR